MSEQFAVRRTMIDGEPALVIGPTVPDGAPDRLKEGLARRQVVNNGGTCPCGARATLPNREQRRKAAKTGEPLIVNVVHEPDCPAGDSHG